MVRLLLSSERVYGKDETPVSQTMMGSFCGLRLPFIKGPVISRCTLGVRVALLAALLCLPGAAVGQTLATPESPGEAWRAEFTDRLVEAWQQGQPMPQLSAAHPDATLEDGYAIQRLFVTRTIDRIGGFKAAIIAQAGQDRMGIDGPLTAIIPASGVLDAADGIIVDLSTDASRHLETEIGYVFSSPISKSIASVDELRNYIASVAAVIEAPGNPTESIGPATAADLAAWNINGKAMIVGARHDPADIDTDSVEIALTRDGAILNKAKGDQAAGGQWETLRRTVNGLVRRGYTVEAGHVITNGALGKVVKAEPGLHRADYGPLGVIEFVVK